MNNDHDGDAYRRIIAQQLNTSALAAQIVECRQIQRRLVALLPERLEQLARRLRRGSRNTGQARRRALLHEEYQRYLAEVLEVKRLYHKLRLEWEHRARQRHSRISL